jgi:hypothetical protein
MQIFFIISLSDFTSTDISVIRDMVYHCDPMYNRLIRVACEDGGKNSVIERLKAYSGDTWKYRDLCPPLKEFEKQEVDPVVETQSLTNPSEYLDDRTPLPDNILSGRKFYHLYCGRSSTEVVSFFEDFLLKSKVPHEVILIAHTSSSVQALYGFDSREINENARRRLGMRRKLSIQQRFSHLSDSLEVKTKIAPLQDVWMFIRQFYRDLLVVEGVEQEAIRQIAHTTVVENTAAETPRPRQQSGEVDIMKRIHEVSNRILEVVLAKRPVSYTFKLVGDVIDKLVIDGLFHITERPFLVSNKSMIQTVVNKELERLRGEMTEEQRSEQRSTLLAIQREQREARRAQAKRYADMIETYCDKNLDEYEFCPIKHAYSSRLLEYLKYNDEVTDEEFADANGLRVELDELLSEARARNEENNKEDCKKVQDVTKDLVRVFVCDLCIDQLGHNRFRENPRAFVRDMIEFSDIPFAKHKLQVFHGKHHSVIVETVLQRCRHFLDTFQERIEQASRELSEAEGNPERSAWEERERVRTLRLEKLQSLHDPYDAWLRNVEEAGELQYNAWIRLAKRDGKNKVFEGLWERGETLKNLYKDLMTELAIERTTKVHHRLHVLQLQNLIEKHKPMPYEPNLSKFREQVPTGELYEAMTAQFDEMYDEM